MRLEEFFNFDKKVQKKTPSVQRARNKPRDVLGNRPTSREGPEANFTNKDTVRGYKYLASDNVRTNDPDHAEEKKRFRKHYGFGTGPVGKLPENYKGDNNMELKKLFELAGVDATAGKAKKLVEGDLASDSTVRVIRAIGGEDGPHLDTKTMPMSQTYYSQMLAGEIHSDQEDPHPIRDDQELSKWIAYLDKISFPPDHKIRAGWVQKWTTALTKALHDGAHVYWIEFEYAACIEAVYQ